MMSLDEWKRKRDEERAARIHAAYPGASVAPWKPPLKASWERIKRNLDAKRNRKSPGPR
jgi:hypothetical protein